MVVNKKKLGLVSPWFLTSKGKTGFMRLVNCTCDLNEKANPSGLLICFF